MVLAAAACGGSSGSSITVTAENEQSAFSAAICQIAAQCNEVENVAECITSQEGKYPDPTDAQFAAAVAAGTIKFDATTLQACLDALLAQPCDANLLTSHDVPAACSSADAKAKNGGTVVDGGNCFFNDECVSGRCSNDGMGCSDACCPGTCDTTSTIVADGAGCDGTNTVCPTGDTCVNGSCRAYGAAGADCASGNDCQSGYSCPNNLCALLPTVGQTCVPDTGCFGAGVQCFTDTAGASTCKATVSRGESCADALCKGFSTCDATTMKCIAEPIAGEPCVSGICGPGTYCDESNGTSICTALLADGAACSNGESFTCVSGFCDANTSKCAEIAACQ